MSVCGTTVPGYESFRAAFASAQSIDAGGAQLAIYHNGVKVVDLWTGNDHIRNRPFDGAGYHVFASATKALAATVAHLLAERGQLDINAPIATYWREFGQHGKEKITLRMVLTHTSGCPALPSQMNITMRDSVNWDKIIHCLEDMTPFYEPGTQVLYAPFTFGYLIGEVVRRITGKTIGTLFAEEIARPLDLSLWIGLPEEKEDKFIPVMNTTPLEVLPDKIPVKVKRPPPDMSDPLVSAYATSFSSTNDADFRNSREAHAAEIPASNGIGDARSLAKFYAHLIGEVDGKPPLLSKETLKRITKTQTDDIPVAAPFRERHADGYFRFALGYEKPSPLGQPMLGENSFGHVGFGGRLGFADLDSGFAVAYICNNPVWDSSYPDPRWLPWMDELRNFAKKE